MKKIININFQGRVIPIEETAYDILKQYVESLRNYFANEEGRDEIINDIESRIAELFDGRLKKGSACITDAAVNAVIDSIGRPADLEQAENDLAAANASANSGNNNSSNQQQSYTTAEEPRRWYRSENDKVLGGVCGGLANYLKIDPAVVRILFAIITLGGFGTGILLYIIFWIVLPSRALASNSRKRLYRNPDDKVIGGVASGVAAYFHIDTWIPRLIFALPLIFGGITSIFNNAWFDFNPGPVFITGGFGGTLFITYIVLWIVLPEAVTATEKLEMRGEKVDLESISKTVKEDLEHLKARAEKFGGEVKEKAQEFGSTAKEKTQSFASEAAPIARRTGTGFGHAVGVLFKAFFLFIAGIIAFALLMALMGILFGGIAGGVSIIPFKGYLLDGFWQNVFLWGTLILFLAVPVIALLVWLVRRIMGIRSKNHYLGYVFGTLWTLGWVSVICLVGGVSRNFKTRSGVESTITINQPIKEKMIVDVASSNVRYYGSDWYGIDWDHKNMPFYGINEDTLMLNTVRVNITKSKDNDYHIYQMQFSRGNNPEEAKALAQKINFTPILKDSVLTLPKGFAITRNEKFRNQQVLIVVEVPVGKKIAITKAVEDYEWFSINVNNRRGWNMQWDENWDNSYRWDAGVEYIMTPDGLERLDKLDLNELKNGKFKLKIKEDGVDIEAEGEFKNKDEQYQYRYKQLEDSIKDKVKEKLREEMRVKDSLEREKKIKQVTQKNSGNEDPESIDEPVSASGLFSPVTFLSKF